MTLTVEISGTTGGMRGARRALMVLGLVGAASLPACADSPQRREEASMAQANGPGSNVPAPPSVDRSKCSDKGKQIVTADTNLDKKPDVWKFFTAVQQGGQSVSVLSCKQVDLNHDGKVDMVYYYDETGAQTTLEEFDLDFDG